MRFVATALVSAGLTAVLLLLAPGPPVGPVTAFLALWFIPGYAVQAACLPAGQRRVAWPERLVISSAVSLALLAVISVVYDALGNRLTATAVIWMACGVTQLASVAGLVRSVYRRDPMLPRRFELPPRSWLLPGLAVAIVVTGGLSVLAWKPPPRDDLYVELSILDKDGKVPVVPLRVRSAEAYEFTVRVSSHAASGAEYVVRIDGPDRTEPGHAGPFTLVPGRSLDVSFLATWTSAGPRALSVTLERDGVANYRSLHLITTVAP